MYMCLATIYMYVRYNSENTPRGQLPSLGGRYGGSRLVIVRLKREKAKRPVKLTIGLARDGYLVVSHCRRSHNVQNPLLSVAGGLLNL